LQRGKIQALCNPKSKLRILTRCDSWAKEGPLPQKVVKFHSKKIENHIPELDHVFLMLLLHGEWRRSTTLANATLSAGVA
jgi:hypothetical protein